VVGLAVDDRSDPIVGVLAHPFPDTHDVAARGVDNLATPRLDPFVHRDLGTESGHNNHILG
jgi:hypothetical protein